MLIAQTLNKLSQYSESAEAYFKILKKFPKADNYADIVVNAVSSAISSNVSEVQENARVLTAEYLRSSKGQNDTRDIVYNYSVLLSAL